MPAPQPNLRRLEELARAQGWLLTWSTVDWPTFNATIRVVQFMNGRDRVSGASLAVFGGMAAFDEARASENLARRVLEAWPQGGG